MRLRGAVQLDVERGETYRRGSSGAHSPAARSAPAPSCRAASAPRPSARWFRRCANRCCRAARGSTSPASVRSRARSPSARRSAVPHGVRCRAGEQAPQRGEPGQCRRGDGASQASPAPTRSRPMRPSNLTLLPSAVNAALAIAARRRRCARRHCPAAARPQAGSRRRRCRRCPAPRPAPPARAARRRRRGPEVEAAPDIQPVRPRAGPTAAPGHQGGRVELIQFQAALQVPGRLRRRARECRRPRRRHRAAAPRRV